MIALILLNEGTQDIDVVVDRQQQPREWLNSESYIGFGKVQTLGLCNSNTRKVQGGQNLKQGLGL